MSSTPRTSTHSVAAVLITVKLALVAPVAIGTAIAAAGKDQPVSVVGCLQQGPVKGTFVLTQVTAADKDKTSNAEERRVDTPVMSTVIGLTGHVGRKVWVRGVPGENKRNGAVLKVRSLKVLEGSCS